jgi:hypothetical protein
MAAWLSGKADGKTIFCKMHKHLGNHYKKWTGKKRENENMMNSLKKIRYQAMLQRFLNHCHTSIMTVWRISITNSPWKRKLGEK